MNAKESPGPNVVVVVVVVAAMNSIVAVLQSGAFIVNVCAPWVGVGSRPLSPHNESCHYITASVSETQS